MRLERAVPYIYRIRNTSCYWLTERILKDLYGWDEPITLQNWQKLHGIIRKNGGSAQTGRDIMKKAGITKSNTELWRGRDGSCDDIFTYSLEWSFFTRSQWGFYDTALIELEHAWNHDEPCPPLPVTAGEGDLRFEKKIATIDDVEQAMEHYINKIPFDRIITIASHFSTFITYRKVTRDEMNKALSNRADAGEWERDVYANYVSEEFLRRFEQVRPDMVLQFSMAAEPLPYETVSMMHTKTAFELAEIVAAHPKLKFNFHIANAAINQSFCTMARELPNLSLNGYWWHNFFPTYIDRVLRERLDMVAINKQVGFFTVAQQKPNREPLLRDQPPEVGFVLAVIVGLRTMMVRGLMLVRCISIVIPTLLMGNISLHVTGSEKGIGMYEANRHVINVVFWIHCRGTKNVLR